MDRLSNVAAGQTITVKEGSGIAQQRALRSSLRASKRTRRNDEDQGIAVSDVTQRSACDLLKLIASRKISPLELAEEHIRADSQSSTRY